MTLSYDLVFALLARMAISGISPEFETSRCALHPFKKRAFMKVNPELVFTARASTLLAYEKLSDDVADEKGAKKLAARAARLFLKGGKNRAETELPQLYDKIRDGLSRLSAVEAKREATVDTPADIFGGIMADIMEHGYEKSDKKIAREIGLHAGRWVYIVDALDDCEDDVKKGRYNPFFLLYGDIPSEEQKKKILEILNAELIATQNALDLVDRGGRRDLFEILENITEYGMKDSAKSVIKRKDKSKK